MRSAPTWVGTTAAKATAGTIAVAIVSTIAATNFNPSSVSVLSGSGTAGAAKSQPDPTSTPCNNGNGNGNGNGGCVQGSGNKTFTVAGSAAQLVPGALRTLSLSVKNHASQAIKVRTLTVQASDVRNAFGVVVCPASNLLLGGAATASGTVLGSGTASSGTMIPSNLQVAGGATVIDVDFPIRLAASAGDGCKNVTWQLTFSGTADQA